MDGFTATETAYKNGYADARKEILQDNVIILKEEYERLQKEAALYDPAPWCKLGICEGVSKKCKDTCPDSIYTQIREEAIVDFLVSTEGWTSQQAKLLMRQYMGKTYGIEYRNTDSCIVCGAEIPEGRQVCPTCEYKIRKAIQNS